MKMKTLEVGCSMYTPKVIGTIVVS